MSRQASLSQSYTKNSEKLCIAEDVQTKYKRVTLLPQRTNGKTQAQSAKEINPLTYFQKLQLNELIKQLKQKGGIERQKLIQLIDISQNIFQFEPNVLRTPSPVMIVGDIHGQFFDLLNIFEMHGFPSEKKFLFLGDYVDRGLFCIEVLTLLLVLKVKYEKNINLLRGNHEGKVMTMNFNFRLQCQKKYGIQIYERFVDLFCKFPLCAVIDDTYFAVHGGISPQIKNISIFFFRNQGQLEKIHRFVEIQNRGVICDLVWSDPSQNNTLNWETNHLRGCSYFYSKIQTKRFLKDNKIKMIIRGHEVQIQGYNYQKSSNDEKLTLTIFSAPNYCDTYHNKGAVAEINDVCILYQTQNKISIHRFSEVAHPYVPSNYMNGFEYTIPGMCQLVGKLFLHMLKNKHRSRKSSMINDKIFEELNALKRIEVITKFFQEKFLQHEEIIEEESKKELSKDLQKSYEIAYEIFIQKKNHDEDEKFPTEADVLSHISSQSLTKPMQQIHNKVLVPISLNVEHDQVQVFGPKLQMKNNIYKKFCNQEESQLEEIPAQ